MTESNHKCQACGLCHYYHKLNETKGYCYAIPPVTYVNGVTCRGMVGVHDYPCVFYKEEAIKAAHVDTAAEIMASAPVIAKAAMLAGILETTPNNGPQSPPKHKKTLSNGNGRR